MDQENRGGTNAGGAGTLEPPGEQSSVPFEDPSRPFMERFIATVKLAFSDPVKLFSNMGDTDIGPPVIYGVIIGTIGMVLGLLWNMLFGGLATLAEGAPEEFAISTAATILIMFFSPILVVVGLFISAGLYHVSLLILGDGSRGFGMTLRAVCYGSTPNLLAIVPICGGIVGGIWGLVLVIMGSLYGHRTDTWRAILAYFLPMIACCCVAIFLAMVFGVIGGMAN